MSIHPELNTSSTANCLHAKNTSAIDVVLCQMVSSECHPGRMTGCTPQQRTPGPKERSASCDLPTNRACLPTSPPWQPAGHPNSVSRYRPAPRRTRPSMYKMAQALAHVEPDFQHLPEHEILASFESALEAGTQAHRVLLAWAQLAASRSASRRAARAEWARRHVHRVLRAWFTLSQGAAAVAAVAHKLRSARLQWGAMVQWRWYARLCVSERVADALARTRLLHVAFQVRPLSTVENQWCAHGFTADTQSLPRNKQRRCRDGAAAHSWMKDRTNVRPAVRPPRTSHSHHQRLAPQVIQACTAINRKMSL